MSFPVRVHDLSKKFRGLVAVNHLNLEVPDGGIYGLVGTNGAGKTTTIKVLMNILRPTSGWSDILGVNSRNLSPREFALIGYVSENQEIPEWMTVEYFLRYLKFFYPTWDDALAGELVRQFNLPLSRKLGQLSRGMRMKAALVSSLAYHPRVIVLDEPFSGLDPLVRDEFVEGLLEQAAGATMLISSHDLAEIESFASHIGYMEDGRLQFSEEMTSLSNRFREIEVTLEAPPQLPNQWADSWICLEASSAIIRFIDSQFDRERTLAEVQRLFPAAKNVSVNPLPLRAIFVALAKNSRKAA